jgi:outer membrane receptor for ferrienterochelin and colicins
MSLPGWTVRAQRQRCGWDDVRRSLSLGVHVSALLLWTSAAFAQSNAAEAVPACRESLSKGKPGCDPIEVVVVGTRTPESTQRATIRTGVVTREEAERRGARNVGEALAGETSLQVNPEAYGYLGRPSGVQIQGLDAERVLILEDGERVMGDSGGVVDLSKLPLTDVERIEYVMGPTSSLYGSNALGGVINVVTSAPRAEGVSGRARIEGRSRGELLWAASAAYRGGGDWVGLDSSAEYQPGLAVAEGRPDFLVPQRKTRLLGLRSGTTVGRRIELRLKLHWVHDELLGLTSEQVPVLGVYLVDLPETTDRVVLRARETLHLSEAARLDLSLGRSWFTGEARRDRRNSPIDEVRARRLASQNIEAALTIADRQTRTWVLGARSDAEQFSQDLKRTEVNGTELRVRSITEVEPTVLASGAAFGQLAWRLHPSFTLLPGARVELHDRYGAILAPRLAASFQPQDQVTLRGALGRGFRAPSAKEYGFLFDHSAIGYRVLGNPSLEPERSWGVNGDARFNPKSWLLVRGGGFANWVSQLIGTDLAADQPNAGVTDYTYVNVARAKTAGCDGLVRLSPERNISLELGYAYLWTKDDSTGHALPNRPPHTLTAAARSRLFGRLEGSARYRWVSSAFVEDDVRAPSFGALDLRLSYRIWRDVQAYVGALNVLDTKKDPNRLGDVRPAVGRSFYLGVSGDLPGSTEAEHAQAN